MKLPMTKRFSLIVLSTMIALSLAVLLSTSITARTASAHSTHAQRPNSGSGAVIHTHIATAANSAGNWTDINNAAANNHPDAVVTVTPNKSAGVNGIVDTHAIGVWYDAMAGKWAIFNEDGTAIPHGAAFNVYAVPTAAQPGDLQSVAITFTVTAANSKANWADLDNINTNNTPNVFLNVTPRWNGAPVAFDTHPVGVWYDTTTRKWAIFNEGSMDAIPVGTVFNVFVNTSVVHGIFLHQATSANTSKNSTIIDNPVTNNDPNALLFVTPNFNPQGQGGTYEDHTLAVSYQNGKWSIFNVDGAPLPMNAAFDVLATDPYPSA